MRFKDVFEKINGRTPTTEEILQFERLTTALETAPNDALLAVLVALDHYERLYSKIPATIKQSAESAAKGAAEQAQAEVEKAVASLVPAVESAVSHAASSAVQRVQLGRSMFTIWLGTVALALAVGFGWVLGSKIFTTAATGHITWTQFFSQSGFGIGLASFVPPLALYSAQGLASENTTWWHLAGGGFAILIFAILAFGVTGYV